MQLFNAVRSQQRSLEEKLKDAGASERKREKVMESITKGKFLDMLKGDNKGRDFNVIAEGTHTVSQISIDKSHTFEMIG